MALKRNIYYKVGNSFLRYIKLVHITTNCTIDYKVDGEGVSYIIT